MTHRELLNMAMPLISLTNEQWDLICEHLEKHDAELSAIIRILICNQARIEVTGNYLDYYFDSLEKQVSAETVNENVF